MFPSLPPSFPPRRAAGLRRCALALLLLACLQAGAARAGEPPSKPAAGPDAAPAVTAFVHVAVLPMTRPGARLADQTVIVRGDRIAAMGPAAEVPVPRGARVVDGGGSLTLLPGLADLHVHLPPFPGAPDDPAQRVLALMVANGVTTARGMAGNPAHLVLRDRVAAGELLGPALYVAAPALHGGNTATLEAARAAVAAAAEAGYDLVKSHHIDDPAVWSAVQEAATAAKLPVAGHVANEVGLERAMAAGQQVEHLDGFVAALLPPGAAPAEPWGQFPPPELLAKVDRERIAPLAAEMARRGVWNVPTLSLFEQVTDVTTPTAQLAARPEMAYASPEAVSQWSQQREGMLHAGVFPPQYGEDFRRLRREIVAALAAAGAPLMAGSDTPQAFQLTGFALHDEIAALAAAGLTPWQALDAATAAPARYLRSLPREGSATGRAADFGTVEPGRRADLLLVAGDPLADLGSTRAIQGVMLAGQWLDRPALDRLLADAATAARPEPPPAPAPAAAETPTEEDPRG